MMRHFSDEEWLVFKEGMVPPDLGQKMENHLVECDRCRERFLMLFGDKEIGAAETLLSEDFTDRVLDALGQEKGLFPKEKKRVSRPNKDSAVYFAVAAAITILLMGSGIFQSLVDIVPQFASRANVQEQWAGEKTGIGWSEKLVDQTADWMQNFEMQGRGGSSFD
ncbi:hypothetical protein [Candidatus Formimonas warabiya]|uniref:Zf-HC2 domain-containing protein n=1 Tax=Formimonas warabiya TaxID=1761012 RepID=A0A3G1KVT3_FORW1|nr:hypothetical protein [Candidatus Formimonas warabiya]ATW26497.1 hypothetical protein DCMF_18625 [Candidatus Formimonas warabiya]